MVGFGIALISFAFVSATTPQWVLEVQMFVLGAGMGLTMTPATNAIMSAVPREKAGAGSAVNNTVRQVAGALGVAILGSVLAVVFRGDLGSNAPAQLAAKLDQPAAIVSTLPKNAQARTYVQGDSSQSIGNAFEFVGDAGAALQQRAKLPIAAALTPAQRATAKATAQKDIDSFISSSKSSFVDAMGVTSILAGAAALLGAGVAFRYLPGRRETAELAGRVQAPAETAMAH
jgi:DHA2 family integral membrane protein (MFS transporter)